MKVDQATETTDLGVNIKQEYIESIALSKQPRRKRCKFYQMSQFKVSSLIYFLRQSKNV